MTRALTLTPCLRRAYGRQVSRKRARGTETGQNKRNLGGAAAPVAAPYGCGQESKMRRKRKKKRKRGLTGVWLSGI
jgi:hypothetical protein